jgi:hypothetical protein
MTKKEAVGMTKEDIGRHSFAAVGVTRRGVGAIRPLFFYWGALSVMAAAISRKRVGPR